MQAEELILIRKKIEIYWREGTIFIVILLVLKRKKLTSTMVVMIMLIFFECLLSEVHIFTFLKNTWDITKCKLDEGHRV